MKKLFLIISVLSACVGVRAQEIIADTTTATLVADTLVLNEKIIKKPHSPRKATFLALALPGSGQIYNGQWWKVPILYGGIGATVYGISWNSTQFKKYKTAFVDYTVYLEEKAKDPDLPYPENPSWDKVYIGGDVEGFTPQQQSTFKKQLQNKKDNFKRNRDLLYIVMGAVYALQVIDACVFAHFYDFEIDEDLSLNIRPTSFFSPTSGGMVGLTLTLNF